MARLLLFALGGEEFPARPNLARMRELAHLGKDLGIAGEEPRFHEIGRDRDVAFRFTHAFFDRAYAVADLKPHVPEKAHERFNERASLRRAALEQDHDVDVGPRVQLATTVAADRD